MRRLILLLYSISTFLFSCNPTGENNIDHNFVLCLFNKDESPTSFLLVEHLDKDENASVQIPLSTARIREREYIQKDGFFYRLSNSTSVFTRYQLQGSSLVLADNLQLRNPDFEAISWKDDEKLLTVCREDIAEQKSQARVYQNYVKDMKIVREDTIILPHAMDEFWALHVA